MMENIFASKIFEFIRDVPWQIALDERRDRGIAYLFDVNENKVTSSWDIMIDDEVCNDVAIIASEIISEMEDD